METVLFIIELIGVVSFSASGAMVAIDKETDMFGVILLSVVTCFGGGLLRDIIRSQGLPLFFTDMTLEIIICVITALVVFWMAFIFKKKYVEREEFMRKVNNVLDALGIGVFTAAGAEMCLNDGPFVAIVLAMITSVGGSLTRDIILNDIPFFLKKRIYALTTIIGAAVYYIIATFAPQGGIAIDVVATVACTLVVFGIRMLATAFKWNMVKAIDFTKIKSDSNTQK